MESETKAKKPGVKSSEFWLPGGALAGLQHLVTEAEAPDQVKVAGAIAIAIVASVYIVARTMLKLRLGAEAELDLVVKSDEPTGAKLPPGGVA